MDRVQLHWPGVLIMLRYTTLIALLAAALVACGGSTNDREQIQATERASLAAFKANDAGDICRLMTDHDGCLTALMTARAFGTKPSDFLDGDEEDKIDTMKVTINGNHAVSARGNEFEKRDGKWLKVFKEESRP